MRLLAALYVAGMLTWLGVWAIRKSDKYFWQGIAWGLMAMTLYVTFLLSVIYLLRGTLKL